MAKIVNSLLFLSQVSHLYYKGIGQSPYPLMSRASEGSPLGRAPAIAGERVHHCDHLPSPSATPPPSRYGFVNILMRRSLTVRFFLFVAWARRIRPTPHKCDLKAARFLDSHKSRPTSFLPNFTVRFTFVHIRLVCVGFFVTFLINIAFFRLFQFCFIFWD